jgi:hypothetical protein
MNGPVAGACWWNAMDTHRKLRNQGEPNVRYVEGWGVRESKGKLEPFEHGWAETDGMIVDETPEHGCVAYFPALRSENPGKESAERGIDVPLYRPLTCPHVGGEPNPKYDAAVALAYAKAKLEADEYCRKNQRAER